MPKVTVTSPITGEPIEIDAPEGSFVVASPDTGEVYVIEAPEGSTPAQLKARVRNYEKRIGYRTQDLINARFMQEITLGGWDEVAGAVDALTDEAVELFGGKKSDFVRAYEEGKAQQLARAELASEVSPVGAATADIASLLFGGGTLAKAAATVAKPGIRELSRQMAVTGAGLGALGGALGGEGVEGRVAGAVGGATVGGLLGGLTPAAFLGTARGVQWANRFFRGDKDAGLRYLEEVLKAEQITPSEITQQMQRAQDLGVPLRPADVRSGLRGALGAATRAPSAARNQGLEEIRARQAGLTDRLTDAISRNLGPITNLRKQETDLVEKARTAAEPLYKAAYRKPIPINTRLQSILDTPAGRDALKRARTIAANERRNPTKMGFILGENGEVTLGRTPSMQTLDYVKRGFDDELNALREPVTNKLRLDEGGRAVLMLKNDFVQELDRVNPAYAKARAAWGGEISKKNAMLDGQNAVNYTADELEYILSLKEPIEQEFFKLGYRKAISNRLESKGDFADTARDLLGTRQKRKALQTVFGESANFDDFTEAVANEALTVATFNELTGNSKTAERLFEALNYSDALSGVPGASASLLRSDPGGLIQAALGRMTKQAQQRTQSAADQTLMQTLLAETPQTAMQELSRVGTMNAQQAAQRQRQAELAAGATAPATAIGGVLTGIGVSEVPEERQPLQSELLAGLDQIAAASAPQAVGDVGAGAPQVTTDVNGFFYIDGERVSRVFGDGMGITDSGKVAQVRPPNWRSGQ